MADIIIGPQVVDSVVRFKMHGNHLVDVAVFKGGFITVNVIRIFLIDCLYIFKKHTGMQHIVMIKQADIFSRGH